MAHRKASEKNMRNIQRGMTPDQRERSFYGENVRLATAQMQTHQRHFTGSSKTSGGAYGSHCPSGGLQCLFR